MLERCLAADNLGLALAAVVVAAPVVEKNDPTVAVVAAALFDFLRLQMPGPVSQPQDLVPAQLSQ